MNAEEVFETLVAYIDHVSCCEGVHFLNPECYEKSFTPQQWELLQKACKVIDQKDTPILVQEARDILIGMMSKFPDQRSSKDKERDEKIRQVVDLLDRLSNMEPRK
jgi:hypothetical protein